MLTDRKRASSWVIQVVLALALFACSGGTGRAGGGGSRGTDNEAGVAGSAGAMGGKPECTAPGECTLHDDCCNCVGLAAGEEAPICTVKACFASTCQGLGSAVGSSAACVVGRCVAAIDCDRGKVKCAEVEPVCAAGLVPSVTNGCWGSCVSVLECQRLVDCSACDRSVGQVCVAEVQQGGNRFHCVTSDQDCGTKPSCACMGASVCLGAFNQCVDGVAGLECHCPAC